MTLALLLLASSFTQELWDGIRPVYARTIEHPFLRGLSDGSLPKPRFRFYLLQDAHYLRSFSQALNVLASKAPREEWMVRLNGHAAEALQEERQLHESLLGSFGVTREEMASAAMAPTNAAYTNHLLVTVERGTFAEGLAAMLPCYWVYWEVGRELARRGSRDPDYQRWIRQYSAEEYGKAVREVLAMMDAEAAGLTLAQKQRCTQLFARSARYEYMFWDMAWKEEQWPPK